MIYREIKYRMWCFRINVMKWFIGFRIRYDYES